MSTWAEDYVSAGLCSLLLLLLWSSGAFDHDFSLSSVFA